MPVTEELDRVLRALSSPLLLPAGLDSFCFLKAISGVESSFGRDQEKARFEPAYAPDGFYYERKNAGGEQLQRQFARWGKSIAYSYGPMQIMYATALQFGYPEEKSPDELKKIEVSGPYVVKFIQSIVQRGASTLEQIADGYNSGNYRDFRTVQVQKYVAKVTRYYATLKTKELKPKPLKEGPPCV